MFVNISLARTVYILVTVSLTLQGDYLKYMWHGCLDTNLKTFLSLKMTQAHFTTKTPKQH